MEEIWIEKGRYDFANKVNKLKRFLEETLEERNVLSNN